MLLKENRVLDFFQKIEIIFRIIWNFFLTPLEKYAAWAGGITLKEVLTEAIPFAELLWAWAYGLLAGNTSRAREMTTVAYLTNDALKFLTISMLYALLCKLSPPRFQSTMSKICTAVFVALGYWALDLYIERNATPQSPVFQLLIMVKSSVIYVLLIAIVLVKVFSNISVMKLMNDIVRSSVTLVFLYFGAMLILFVLELMASGASSGTRITAIGLSTTIMIGLSFLLFFVVDPPPKKT